MAKVLRFFNKPESDRQFDEAHGNYDTQDHTWDDNYPEGEVAVTPDYDAPTEETYPAGQHGEHPFSNHL